MFTGIIETTGQLRVKRKTAGGIRLQIRTRTKLKKLTLGQSLSINGVCLTLVHNKARDLSFDVIRETLRCTNLGSLGMGDVVNVERSLKYGSFLDGHYVLGHVEGVGRITRNLKEKRQTRITVTYPRSLRRCLVSKGSVALDGISLTIARLQMKTFEVCLTPHTLRMTNLSKKTPRDILNIETDILLRRRQS